MSPPLELEPARECVINAEGFTVTFEFPHLAPGGEGFVTTRIESKVDRRDEDTQEVLREHITSIEFSDLPRLAQYFAQHIQAIKTNPDHVSNTFICRWDMDFKIEALSGSFDKETLEGEFGIRFMHRAELPEKRCSYWIGLEGTLLIDLAELFVLQLQNSYAALSQDSNKQP